MYRILDNGKPADCHHHKVHKSWDNSTFATFEEALVYARKWLGPLFGGSLDGKDGIILQVNTPWDYNGHGDTIEIRECKV